MAADPAITVDSARNKTSFFIDLPVGSIRPSPLNPRSSFDDAGLEELARSIRQHGVLQPLLVRPKGGGKVTELTDEFELVAGERRWRAAKLAGLETVPCQIVEDIDDTTALQLMLVENLQRQDLDPIEEARGYRDLQERCGLKQKDIADMVRKAQPTIANRLRLLELPEEIQKSISEGELKPAHGVALASFKAFPELVKAQADYVVRNNIPVHSLEEEPLRNSWQLQQLHLIARVANQVDKTQCQQCPHDAYRAPWCLKPECHEKRLEEAVARQSEDLAKVIAEASAKGQRVVRLCDLKYGEYQRLDQYGGAPPGCKRLECEKVGRAVDYDDKLVAICVDPKCWRRLKGKATAEANKVKKTLEKSAISMLRAKIDGITALGFAEAIVLSVTGLRYRDVQVRTFKNAFGRHRLTNDFWSKGGESLGWLGAASQDVGIARQSRPGQGNNRSSAHGRYRELLHQ